MKIKSERKYKLIEVWSGEIINQIQEQIFYNQDETIAESQVYSDGILNSRTIYNHDKNGNILKEVTTDQSNRLYIEIRYIYRNGEIMEKKEIYSHGSGNTLKFYYDSLMNRIREVEYNSDDLIIHQIIYNQEERKSINQEFDLDGILSQEKILYYNHAQKVIKELDKYYTEDVTTEEVSYPSEQLRIEVLG